MLNPDDLVGAWVQKLSAVAELVAALGGDSATIQGYSDSYPDQNLRAAILDMPAGSILVVFMGTNRARVNGALAWRHNFNFHVRIPQSTSGASFNRIWHLFVSGVPQGTTLPLLRTAIHEGCYPMDLELPQSQRMSILVSPDGATFDYFEFQAALVEIGDN